MRTMVHAVLAVALLAGAGAPLSRTWTIRAGTVTADAAGVTLAVHGQPPLGFGRPRLVTPRETLEARPGAPREEGGTIVYDHGAWDERYLLRSDALQQAFVIREPIRTEASIRVPVRTPLDLRSVDGRTLAFVDGDGARRLAYRDALAMDAGGRILELPLRAEGDEIVIALPADYLASARYPVLVDPVVGGFQTLSPAGGLWRMPGVHIAWNSKDEHYLAVWHQDIVFDDPPNNHGHPPHNWLTGSIIRARAIRIDSAGNVTFGDPIDSTKPYVGATLGPVQAGFAAFGPRVEYNPVANEFLVVWSEGKWEVGETPDVDTDGDGLVANDPDRSIFGDIVTDLDDNDIVEFPYSQDPFPPNTRVVGRRVVVDPATLATTPAAAAPLEVSLGAGGVPGNPNGVPGGAQDSTAIHPALRPDVAWDGLQYVIVWQTLESPTLGTLEDANPGFQLRHVFLTHGRARSRLYDGAGTALSGPVDLANSKERFFIKGPTDQPGNIVDGSVSANLQDELAYASVPTDTFPHVDALVLPGADLKMGTADDQPVGSLMVWNVTTLVFNQGKSRVRGRFLPAGTNTPGIVWDIFSPPVQIVQRAYVAAGAARDPGADAVQNSHFLVTFETAEDVVTEGTPKVEFIGSLKMRRTDASGEPVGGVIDLATSDPGIQRYYLGASATWCPETEQYLLAWTQTDPLWNPVTLGASYHPRSGTLLDRGTQLFGTVATAYPMAAAASRSSAIDPGNPYAAPYHVAYVGQEDDFGANYLRRYRFPTAPGSSSPGPGPGPGPSPSPSGSGSDGDECGVGTSIRGSSTGAVVGMALAAAILFWVAGLRTPTRR